MKNQIVIIGANSEIAKGLAEQFTENTSIQLTVISRNTDFYQQSRFNNVNVIKVNDYHEESINKVTTQLVNTRESLISQVFICHGLLHTKTFQPEKRLEDFSPTDFQQIITANTITPMLWLKHLTPILSGKHPCKLVIFSARVGSITDNRLGGWYSYRASKAAMNMLIKSASIELARRAKNIKLISFHPGTTDSPLSKPFQYNVPKGKLFTPHFVAERVIDVVDKLPIDETASFVDWQGKEILW